MQASGGIAMAGQGLDQTPQPSVSLGLAPGAKGSATAGNGEPGLAGEALMLPLSRRVPVDGSMKDGIDRAPGWLAVIGCFQVGKRGQDGGGSAIGVHSFI